MRIQTTVTLPEPTSLATIRAEIDESAWSALYTNESIPFEKPANKGKIAVKVINHYGDEVLKVYEVE